MQAPAPPAKANTAHAPKFTLAVLVLVGVCASIAILFTIFKLLLSCRKPTISLSPASSIASSRDSATSLRRLASLPTHSGGQDLERGDIQDTASSVERSNESMVLRASAWARAILAGPVYPSPNTGAGTNKSRTDQTLSIPVKHAIIVLQPDGEPSLGIASEIQQKDVMVQVDEKELLELSMRSSSGRRQKRSSLNSSNNIADSGGGNDGVDQATQVGSQGSSPSNSRKDLIMDEINGDGDGNVDLEIRGNPGESSFGTRNTTRRRDNLEGGDQATSTVESQDHVGESSAPGSNTLGPHGNFSPMEIEDASGEASPHHRRSRRRRRKRRKGTSEIGCQTDESSFG